CAHRRADGMVSRGGTPEGWSRIMPEQGLRRSRRWPTVRRIGLGGATVPPCCPVVLFEESSQVAAKAWGGRFAEQTDARVEAFTESISFDARLAAVDVRGSQAHSRMLASVGLISGDEAESICSN